MTALAALTQYFVDRPAIAVAVSGGVDSMTLAAVAHRANPDTEMFHAVSPAVPVQATERVKLHAEKWGWRLSIIDAGEMSDPEYLANPANRCYFCKTNLYDRVVENTLLRVASGTNLDDLGDYRPGLIAAEEHQVCHPYVDVGIDKATLREIAGELGLGDLKDLPAAPCLSSRVTTGIAIDANLLPVINTVEQTLFPILEQRISVSGIRCRIRQDEVAIQIESTDALDFSSQAFAAEQAIVRDLFTEAGFARQVLNVVFEPYEKGSAFLIHMQEVR